MILGLVMVVQLNSVATRLCCYNVYTTFSKLEEITLVHLLRYGHISKYYNKLVANSKESTQGKLNAWKMDIHEDIDETD